MGVEVVIVDMATLHRGISKPLLMTSKAPLIISEKGWCEGLRIDPGLVVTRTAASSEGAVVTVWLWSLPLLEL